MAVKAGSNVATKPGMTEQTHFDARSGAAKRTQESFPVKSGMKDMTQFSRVSPGMAPGGEPNPAYHFGPDASSANPSDPTVQGKVLRRQPAPGQLKSSWDMKDANGRGVDNAVGKAVLDEAVLSGAHLPTNLASAKPAPAYTGKDPN